jgi:predicted TIM-barrel fold metal-dependent hydrolase
MKRHPLKPQSGTVQPKILLKRTEHVVERAKFPVIDAHNHLFEEKDPDELVQIMDEVGIQTFINVTGNTQFHFVDSGYTYRIRDIEVFIDRYVKKYPGRFACFTMSDFASCQDGVLITDSGFADRAAAHLERDVRQGALGLKITKELGLRYRDDSGRLIPVDDERLDPVWECAGELGVPVLIHTSDPAAFFLPTDEENEHFETLKRAPDWSFYTCEVSKEQLLEQRDRMISRHPNTTFICAHVANYPENLGYVSSLLDTHLNCCIDISSRIDELGRQPYTAREFLLKYQDRVLFGTDMPLRADIYRTYFRFLETRDEYFDYPDYVGVWGRSRWMIYGLGLPDGVLKKLYHDNGCRLIPDLE